MPVLLINNSQETFTPTQSGAIATWVWEVCQAADRAGQQPWVLTRASDVPMYPWPQTIAVPYPREPRSRLQKMIGKADRKLFSYSEIGMRAFADRLIQTIRQRQMDAVPMVLHNDLELAVQLRQAFPRATIIHHFHNQLGCKSRFARHLAGSCNGISAVSRYTAEWVEQEFGLVRGSVKTVYNGVDSTRFAPAVEVPAGLPIINFHGKTTHHKGPDILLSAALILAERTSEFSLQMVGSNFWHKFETDNYQQKLQSQMERLANRGIIVRRTGHIARAQIPQELRRCRIHTVPSRWDEPFGLVTLEGMASGLATVASETGATPEVLGDAGMLFQRDNAESLAGQLWKLLNDRDLLIDLSRKGRMRALQFTWDATWHALNEALHGTPQPKRREVEHAPLAAEPVSSIS